MLYMVTFTINIPQMLAYIHYYIPYMDPMAKNDKIYNQLSLRGRLPKSETCPILKETCRWGPWSE